MIGGMSSVTSDLSQLYTQSSKSLADAMGRIAAGRKFVQPSDNFSAFLRGSTLENDVKDYQDIKADIATAKQYSDVAQKVGNQVYQDLVKLDKLSVDWTAAAVGSDLRTSLGAEYDALKTTIVNTIANTKINNVNVMQAVAVTYATVKTDSGGGTYAMTMAAGGPNGATIGAFATGASATAQATAALTFLTRAQSMGKTLDNINMIADTVISSKNAAIEEVTGINDAEELAKVTDLQVRQQAAISMLSQANVSRQGLLKLFL